ncbi:hypothetical protein ACHAO9_005909 [Fusarium lateritium]
MEGKCLAAGPSFTGYAVVTIVADVVVAVLPIPVLAKLEIKLAKKIGLILIFTLGIFTTVCSVQRYRQIDQISNPKDGNSTMLVLWGTIEFNVGVSDIYRANKRYTNLHIEYCIVTAVSGSHIPEEG